MTGTIAVVVKGYPRLSETFIAQELRGLEERGLQLRIVSLRHPTDRHTHPVHAEIEAAVDYLPEYLWREPGRVWRAWRAVRRRPAYRAAFRLWLRDLRRDPTPNRGRRFGQAIVMAHELGPDVSHIHVHFLHTPASVARYASVLTGLPWTGSAHAKDIWTSPGWEIREKLADCAWLVTCSGHAAEHLRGAGPDGDKVELVYHGIDARRFPPPAAGRPPRDGSDPSNPVALLCVGRAVEKKGHDVLLDALARLPESLHWRLRHVGGGPLLGELKAQADRLGIADRIDWLGALPQEAVIDRYREADIFALACRVGRDGDRDGLPNVLMEAQSQALACVATRVSAIPELVHDGETGVLVDAENPDALGDALAALIRDPARRQALGDAGSLRVRSAFSFDAGVDRLADKLGAGSAATRDRTAA
jgi:glycosyltransferase involved in cell wall biosynthesis